MRWRQHELFSSGPSMISWLASAKWTLFQFSKHMHPMRICAPPNPGNQEMAGTCVRSPIPNCQWRMTAPARRPALLRTREIVQRRDRHFSMALALVWSKDRRHGLPCRAKRGERFVRPDGTEPGCRIMGPPGCWSSQTSACVSDWRYRRTDMGQAGSWGQPERVVGPSNRARYLCSPIAMSRRLVVPAAVLVGEALG